MEDLAKADVKTIKTFIDNHITADRLLEDVLEPKKEQKKKSAKEPLNKEKKVIERNSQQISDYFRIIND